VAEAFGQLWQSLIDLTAHVVIPDWGQLVGLIPLILLIGILGPIVTLLALGWVLYLVRRPRAGVRFVDPVVAAPIVDGAPVYPAGEPYCPTDRLLYPVGASRCDRCGHDLLVRCPKCGTGRSATMAACGNCGVEVRLASRTLVVRRAGPPPGGAAAA
jgi:hypothetical protein